MSRKPSDEVSFQDLRPSDRQRLMNIMQRGATRREAMGWLMAAGATAAMAGSVVAGATRALADTPKRGGKLTFAEHIHGPDDTLDPLLLSANSDYTRSRVIYGSLTRLTENLQAVPELAEEFLSNDDATVWTFKLKRGVEFHDGKTMTADDVIYSMNRHIVEGSPSKAAALVADVERWEKVNNHEVRAVLRSPNADLPVALGTFHFKIVQDGVTDFSNPVGTGPFRVAEFRPGVRFRGTRFENYWGDGPYLDEFENFGIGDPVARVNALLAGDVDGISSLPSPTIARIEATPGKVIWSTESGSYISIACRQDMMPSGNRDLVLAMKHLMDRERLVRGVLAGHGSFGNDQPINKAYADFCPDIPQRTLDPDKAKFHFQKSGIGSTEIPIVAAELMPGTLDQALNLQRDAAKIGLNIAVKRVANDGYWSAVWLNEPICVVSWNMRPTANIMLTLAYKSDASWNDSFWKNEKFDDLLLKSRSATDPAVRKQMYCDMQTLIHEEAGTIIPAHRNFVDAVGDYVRGRRAVPLGPFGGGEAVEFLWRADA